MTGLDVFRVLFEEAQDGLFVFAADGRLELVNPRGAAITGEVAEALLGRPMGELLRVEPRPRTPVVFDGVAPRTAAGPADEHLIRRRDGALVPVEVATRTLADGRQVAVVRDLSRQRQDELRVAARMRLYALLGEVNAAIVRHGGEDEPALMQAICERACDVGGFRMAWIGFLDRPGGHVVPVARAGHEDGYVQATFAADPSVPTGGGPTGTTVREGMIIICADIASDPRMAPWRAAALARGYRSSAAVPLRRGGQVVGAVNFYAADAGFFTVDEEHLLTAVGHDVSFALDAFAAAAERRRLADERERLQARLAQAQRLESVGRLAGGVAHDFNNMLSVIIGYCEVALRRAGPDAPVHEELAEIRGAALRSAEVTKQLLAFARRQAVAPQLVNLDDAVAASLALLRRLIGAHIALVWAPGRAPWSVLIDPGQVDQVLTSLVANARDAISGTGRVTITTSSLTIDEAFCARHADATPGEYVRLAVSDDGSGMTPETQAHVFEPFYTTKADGRGAGLGLATVYGIVRQNGGFCTVESEVGRGTTVAVHLPRHGAATA